MAVIFSEQVRFGEISEGDLELSIMGPLSPYQFDYTISNETGYEVGGQGKSFFIAIEFKSSLLGGNRETLSLTIHNRSIIQDLDDNTLSTEYVETDLDIFLSYLSEEDEAAASSQSSASIVTLILTFGTSIFIQVALGGTIEATWLLLGTLQLMSFLPLLTLHVPSNFRQFSKNLAVLHGEPGVIPNIFQGVYDSMDIVEEPFNQYFELMGFNTSYILLNSGRKVLLWAVMGIFMGISYILMDLLEGAYKIGKVFTKIDMKLRYGFIIRAISQSYVSLVVSTCLNVYVISWSGDINYMSNLIALSVAIIMMYIPIISFTTIQSASNLNDPAFQKRLKTFIIDLRTTNPLCFHFATIFFFRRAIYACAFVVLANVPSTQVLYLSVVTLSMSAYLVVVRPYKSVLSSVLSLLNEFMLLSMIVTTFRFLDPIIAPSQSKMIGNALVGMVIMTIVMNWVGIIVQGTISFIQKRAKKFKNEETEG